MRAKLNERRKQEIQNTLRSLGLLAFVDRLKYLTSIARCRRRNSKFFTENSDFKVPPKALAFDAYSAPDWTFYKFSGEGTATYLADVGKKFMTDTSSAEILEWGCGPGRIIRHIQAAFPGKAAVYGTDYNPETIVWCNANIHSARFVLNTLHPPLNFGADRFNFIYSHSVLTHLSETVSHEWMDELYRVARPGAVLVMTTHGDSRLNLLLPEELEVYRKTGIVVRGNVNEGKRLFRTCHAPVYLREKLFKKFEVLEHVEAGFPYSEQDVWILRKTA
jgi:SAM-dependent methyltransferase